MVEVGQVTEIIGDKIRVKIQRHDGCNRCNTCTAGVETELMIMEAENLCHAKLGDLVEVGLEESNFLVAVAIMYVIPLIGLLVGIGIGFMFGKVINVNPEIMALLVGFGLLEVTYLIIKKNEHNFKVRKFRPIASQIVKNAE